MRIVVAPIRATTMAMIVPPAHARARRSAGRWGPGRTLSCGVSMGKDKGATENRRNCSRVDADDATSRAAAAVAGHTGDEATARRLAGSDDPSVRATALAALGRMGRLTDDDVRSGLADGSPVVRRRVVALAVDRTA